MTKAATIDILISSNYKKKLSPHQGILKRWRCRSLQDKSRLLTFTFLWPFSTSPYGVTRTAIREWGKNDCPLFSRNLPLGVGGCKKLLLHSLKRGLTWAYKGLVNTEIQVNIPHFPLLEGS